MTETTADQNSDFSSSPPTSRLEDGNLVTNLQCQLKSFQIRVKELEAQNAALYLQLSNCHCQKLVERSDPSAVFGDALAKGRKKSSIGDNMVQLSIGGNHNDVKIKDAKREGENGAVNEAKKNSSRILKTMNRHSKRYVALKVMYFGQRFHGFASVQVDPTIESEIFKALEQTRLLVADRKESQYTRCGRTDKGVSSVGQVISLFLRSKCTDCGVDAARCKAAPEAVCGKKNTRSGVAQESEAEKLLWMQMEMEEQMTTKLSMIMKKSMAETIAVLISSPIFNKSTASPISEPIVAGTQKTLEKT